MNDIENTFDKYSTTADLIALISGYAQQRSLYGMRIVITGYSLDRYRWQEWAAFKALGATIGDSASAISKATVVLVNRYANPAWADPHRAGRKLERAVEKGVPVFRMRDFLIEMRRQLFDLPPIFELACIADTRPQPPTASQGEFDFTGEVA